MASKGAITNEEATVYKSLAQAVATHQIPDDVVKQVAREIASARHKIRGIDVCVYGICIDYFIDTKDWWKVLPELTAVGAGRLRRIEVFPWGIPFPDLFHVRVEQSFDNIPQMIHR